MPQHSLAAPSGRILMLTRGQVADAFRLALEARGDDYRWMTAGASPGAQDSDWIPDLVVVLIELTEVREQCRSWYDALPGLVERWQCAVVLTVLDTDPCADDEHLRWLPGDVLAHPRSTTVVHARIRNAMRMRQLQRESLAASTRLSTMAHKLRTPVQGMMMYLESMLEAAQHAQAAEMESDVRACQAIAQQMSQLIQQCSRTDLTDRP